MRLPVTPERAGIVTRVDTRLLGLAVVTLGGGRRRAGDTVDPRVGLADMRGPGDAVGPDRPLAVVHARTTGEAEEAAETVRRAMAVGEGPVGPVGPPVSSASATRGDARPPATATSLVAGEGAPRV